MKKFMDLTIPIKITLEINFHLDLQDLADENHLRKERGEPQLANLIELGAMWKNCIKYNPKFILQEHYKEGKIANITFGDYLI